jgi:hypothetical protein
MPEWFANSERGSGYYPCFCRRFPRRAQCADGHSRQASETLEHVVVGSCVAQTANSDFPENRIDRYICVIDAHRETRNR